MARTYRRDKLGRFAGSGSISTSTRATTTGARARRNAKSMRQEQAGQTENARYQARSARSASRASGMTGRTPESTAAARSLLQSVSTDRSRRAGLSRQKGKVMERERRSLLRRGSMRGGG